MVNVTFTLRRTMYRAMHDVHTELVVNVLEGIIYMIYVQTAITIFHSSNLLFRYTIFLEFVNFDFHVLVKECVCVCVCIYQINYEMLISQNMNMLSKYLRFFLIRLNTHYSVCFVLEMGFGVVVQNCSQSRK